jgi:small GTP-binding protein
MDTIFKYDVFLSHSSKDKAVVRKLAERLRADGLQIWFDEWIIQPGDIIDLKVEQGLAESRVLILAMSANAFASDWIMLERHTALFRDPANKERRFIPLRLDNAEMNDTLKQFAYVDWRQKSQQEYNRLITNCKPEKEKPLFSKEKSEKENLSPILIGHIDWVRGVAISADGKFTISASGDRTLKIWDLQTYKSIATLEGHSSEVLGVTISADGKFAISASSDRTLKVWDLQTYKSIATLEGHSGTVLGVAISADGKFAISASNDGTLKVWDLQTYKSIATLRGHSGAVLGVAISADGKFAISASYDKTLKVWDLQTYKSIATLKGHSDAVWSVASSADGKFAISASGDRTLKIWDLQTHQSITTLEGHSGAVLGVTISADGKFAISASYDRTLKIWDLQTHQSITTLEGHSSIVRSVVISADGKFTISASYDKTLKIWDLQTYKPIATLEGHSDAVRSVAISADGKFAISASNDGTQKTWDLQTYKPITTLEGHSGAVLSVAISADGKFAISASNDRTLKIWDLQTYKPIATLEGHSGAVWSVAISADGKFAISASYDRTLRIWDLRTYKSIATLRGHSGEVLSVAISADGKFAISASYDKTLRIWDLQTHQSIASLEGHSSEVLSVAISVDGKFAISASYDGTQKIWDLQTHQSITTLKGHNSVVCSVVISADGKFAISASADRTLKIWDLRVTEAVLPSQAAKYTNAKVLLVGESGVGKSGLAYRLTEKKFVPTISTDAVWATQLQLPHNASIENTEREIWLWDFAGQSDYRLIHQLFMDETSLAVLVFNPQSDNPFEGLGQWDKDLQRAARRPFNKILVAGRCDRGGVTVSHESIEKFRTERGFAGFLETSAQTGNGCQELHDAIVQNINWSDIPYTSSPRIFKLLKAAIIKLKDEGKVLLRIVELKQQLEMRLPQEPFTVEELRAVSGLLASPGVVWQLEFGDFVLLQPERINSYAAAVIRKVRKHPEEIGVISEKDVLAADLDFQDMKRLPLDEEQIVLRAMHQTFVEHGLCLREPTEKDMLLIFPSYFKRERPDLEDHPTAFVTYAFSGMLEEIYATLVVRLHHTTTFEKDVLWRFAADFKTQAGKRLGLKMTKKHEGAAEITVYLEPNIPDDTKVTFIRYVHDHLKAKDENVKRIRHYVCPHCKTPVENRKAIENRLARGVKDIRCGDCEERVELFDLIEQKFASEEFQQRVREMEEKARISIDNESRELILVGHAYAIAGEAGQIYRGYTNSDHGIDGEIEFKDYEGDASGKKVYLQLKSGDSYLYKRERDDKEIFTIKKERWAKYWQAQAYPVMLVIRTSDGEIRWMNVTEYLKKQSKLPKQIIFEGEPLTALNLVRMRDRVLRLP